MTNLREGRCLCGRIRVALSGEPLMVAACHCLHCRKTSGSAFSLVAVMPADAVEVSGELAVYADASASGGAVSRRFCAACGSPVETTSSSSAAQGVRIIKLGLFDEIDGLWPSVELFCSRRAGWLPGLGGTVGFAAMPPQGQS